MYKVTRPYMYVLLSGYYVPEAYYYHGDGSDGRHVCTKYHGHTHYYQATSTHVGSSDYLPEAI